MMSRLHGRLTLLGAMTALALALASVVASIIVVISPQARSAELATTETVNRIRLIVADASGMPVAGAMATLTSSTGIETTRFTGANGQVSLPVSGARLQVRAPGLQTVLLDSAQQIPTDQPARVKLLPDEDYAKAMPSSRWLSLLPDGPEKSEFILNCGTCHELTQERIFQNGKPRDAGAWHAAIAMMRAMDVYEVIPPDFKDNEYAAWLAQHLSAEKVAALAASPAAVGDELAGITITEYPLPETDSLPHDLVVGPDGRLWVTAFFHDEIWAIDPATGATQRYPVDNDPKVNAQPRALKFDPDGFLWLVNGGTFSVVRLDPRNGGYQSFGVDMYAHSLDIDSTGAIWVNDYFAKQERIARVSNPDGAVQTLSVPAANRPEQEGLPLPYGLQVDSQGRLYSTQLAANTLIMHDTRSGKSRKFEMPAANSGPRRPGLGPDLALWIPEFNTGYLTRFDPETKSFQRFPLGDSAVGAYDVEVDQDSGVVWVTGSLDSSLLRFNPDSAEVLRVPLPTEPAYTRHLAIDPKSGDVWTAYASLPAASPKLVRVSFSDRGPAE